MLSPLIVVLLYVIVFIVLATFIVLLLYCVVFATLYWIAAAVLQIFTEFWVCDKRDSVVLPGAEDSLIVSITGECVATIPRSNACVTC